MRPKCACKKWCINQKFVKNYRAKLNCKTDVWGVYVNDNLEHYASMTSFKTTDVMDLISRRRAWHPESLYYTCQDAAPRASHQDGSEIFAAFMEKKQFVISYWWSFMEHASSAATSMRLSNFRICSSVARSYNRGNKRNGICEIIKNSTSLRNDWLNWSRIWNLIEYWFLIAEWTKCHVWEYLFFNRISIFWTWMLYFWNTIFIFLNSVCEFIALTSTAFIKGPGVVVVINFMRLFAVY